MKRWGMFFGLFLLLTTTWTHAQENTEKKNAYILGILPFMSTVTLFERFSILRDLLSETLGEQVVIETAKSFDEFAHRTNEGRYALVYTAPHFVPPAIDSGFYEVIAAPSVPVSGHIMVANESSVTSIAQLAGKRLAHPPTSAFVTLIGKEFIKKNGLIGVSQPIYVPHQSHNAAYRAALAGDADAAIIGTYIVDKLKAEGMREVAKTNVYPATAILANTTQLVALQRQRVQQAFIELSQSEKGKTILKTIEFPGFRPSSAAEYEVLRPLWDSIKTSQ